MGTLFLTLLPFLPPGLLISAYINTPFVYPEIFPLRTFSTILLRELKSRERRAHVYLLFFRLKDTTPPQYEIEQSRSHSYAPRFQSYHHHTDYHARVLKCSSHNNDGNDESSPTHPRSCNSRPGSAPLCKHHTFSLLPKGYINPPDSCLEFFSTHFFYNPLGN